jgi:hypothetical protein
MAILSYILSRKWHLASQGSTKRATEIPTALQVAQLISILESGSVSSLWKVAQYYLLSGRNRRARGRTLSSLLKMAVYALMIAITLGALTTAADTWLHKTSSTVLFSKQVTEDSQLKNYGRTAVPYCLADALNDPNNSGKEHQEFLECINNNQYLQPEPKIKNLAGFVHDVIATTLGRSSRNRIEIFDTYAVAVPAKIERYVDYSASTHALKTDCEVKFTVCNVTIDVTEVGSYELNFSNHNNRFPIFNSRRFNATNSITQDKHTFMIMDDSSGTKEIAINGTVSNPFWFAYRDTPLVRYAEWATNVTALKNSTGKFIMPLYNCNTSIYDAKYDSINDTIKNFSIVLANETTTAFFSFLANVTKDWWLTTVQSFYLMGYVDAMHVSSRNFSALAGPTAITFSAAFMGVSAAQMVSQPNLEELHRNKLVAKVPKAAFWSLIVLCMLSVVFVVVLALWAAKEVLADRQHVVEYQVRLTVVGLASQAFGDTASGLPATNPNNLFEESCGSSIAPKRIVLAPNDLGGMDFVTVCEKRGD